MSKDRHWWFIAYPDSLPNNWVDILIETCLPYYISPLHLYDLDSEGKTKKPHYHIIVSFDGPTTFKNVHEKICKPLNATIPKPILSVKGAFNYLTHKNHPDKYPYDIEEIIYLNGASIKEINKAYLYTQLFTAIEIMIVDKNITSIRDLTFKAREKNDEDMLTCIRNNVYYWKEFMK